MEIVGPTFLIVITHVVCYHVTEVQQEVPGVLWYRSLVVFLTKEGNIKIYTIPFSQIEKQKYYYKKTSVCLSAYVAVRKFVCVFVFWGCGAGLLYKIEVIQMFALWWEGGTK